MPLRLEPTATDASPIFELFRASYVSELLTAAVAHLGVFSKLAGPVAQKELQAQLGLADRPMSVLTTALLAMQLLTRSSQGVLDLSPSAREHLLPGGEYYVGDYISLVADKPAVLGMVERLRTNRPADAAAGDTTAWIYKEGVKSAMDGAGTARHFTLALAGRAKNVAPHLAKSLPLSDAKMLVDVGGGTGIYSIAWLQQHPGLRAMVIDRPEVLKIAAEMAERYGVADRLELRAGDMFADPLPKNADVILLSNILHDWDVAECKTLVARCAAALPANGWLVIHDVLLNDALDGPLPQAMYSAALFCVTEGRCYSRAEYNDWLTAAGLEIVRAAPTLVHCTALVASRVKS